MANRRDAVVPGRWTWLNQTHGAEVVTVDEPGDHAGTAADAAVTTTPGAVLAVHTADCAPVVFEGPGVIGVAHAGWRGLVEGVIDATLDAMQALGRSPRRAHIGPCIRPRCYEFGPDTLDLVADRGGDGVRATTAWGTPALDLAAGIRSLCRARGLEVTDTGTCTACSPLHWSHRARGDRGRQAAVAWIQP